VIGDSGGRRALLKWRRAKLPNRDAASARAFEFGGDGVRGMQVAGEDMHAFDLIDRQEFEQAFSFGREAIPTVACYIQPERIEDGPRRDEEFYGILIIDFLQPFLQDRPLPFAQQGFFSALHAHGTRIKHEESRAAEVKPVGKGTCIVAMELEFARGVRLERQEHLGRVHGLVLIVSLERGADAFEGEVALLRRQSLEPAKDLVVDRDFCPAAFGIAPEPVILDFVIVESHKEWEVWEQAAHGRTGPGVFVDGAIFFECDGDPAEAVPFCAVSVDLITEEQAEAQMVRFNAAVQLVHGLSAVLIGRKVA